MTEKYYLLIYYAHSALELKRDELLYNKHTTVENFRDTSVNNDVCLKIHSDTEELYKYEMSYNQMANAINLFLKSNNPQ